MTQSSATKTEKMENLSENLERPNNWVGRKAKPTHNVGWNRTVAMNREVSQVKASVRRKGAYEGLGVLPRADSSLLIKWSGVGSFHVFRASYSKANPEDMGAGEDLGLLRFEWLISCFIGDL